jgi:amidase
MSWEEVTRAHRAKQLASIPKEWLLKSVPNDLNVIHVPAESGLLTARELEITDTVDINVTLANLAQGAWSSVEVTTAYYKRAIIAHQLVSLLHSLYHTMRWEV